MDDADRSYHDQVPIYEAPKTTSSSRRVLESGIVAKGQPSSDGELQMRSGLPERLEVLQLIDELRNRRNRSKDENSVDVMESEPASMSSNAPDHSQSDTERILRDTGKSSATSLSPSTVSPKDVFADAFGYTPESTALTNVPTPDPGYSPSHDDLVNSSMLQNDLGTANSGPIPLFPEAKTGAVLAYSEAAPEAGSVGSEQQQTPDDKKFGLHDMRGPNRRIIIQDLDVSGIRALAETATNDQVDGLREVLSRHLSGEAQVGNPREALPQQYTEGKHLENIRNIDREAPDKFPALERYVSNTSSRSILGYVSPMQTTEVEPILYCNVEECSATYSGQHRSMDLDMHILARHSASSGSNAHIRTGSIDVDGLEQSTPSLSGEVETFAHNRADQDNILQWLTEEPGEDPWTSQSRSPQDDWFSEATIEASHVPSVKFEDLHASFDTTGMPQAPQEVLWDHVHYRKPRIRSLSTSSGSSSYANSVLSTASLASSATDLSKHSGYSAMQIARATKELIRILQDDTGLAPLYKRAIADPSIGSEKLERNLRRMFRNYAELLEQAAGDTLEHLASRLVKTKARAVAQAIIQKHGTIDHGMRQSNARDEEEQSSDEETNAQPVDESLFEDLVIFREFLTGSEAFETLHAQIRSFILPKSERKKITDVAREGRDATPPKELEPAVTDIDTASHPPKPAREDIVDVATKDGEAFDIPTRDREACDTNATYDKEHIVNGTNMIKPVSSHQTLADRIRPTISDAMIAIGYLEPPLRPGYNRLRWQCVSRVRTLALDQYDSFLYRS